ncbi:HSP90 family protein [Sandaracinus amylolyticus]|uniref:HSP90 family protein n=1 Tax=Sandaracinus amylolyticus TaxID=927083 RepID=UPI001F3E40AA|nr:HSP90 family protein [Sandaracinus amylolyticus]UJR87199.1 Hypothetical protein I5071_93000 [Sandaracinus amylolyticus]
MDHRFQIDLRGLIDLLSNHLYSSPDVFLRELLQNAVDAHTALAIAGRASGPGQVRVVARGDGELIVEDDGIGLTEDEVHRFLATIGQSSKRLEESPAGRDFAAIGPRTSEHFLGQFGIGLLACFVVSDEIEVRTRSARHDDAPSLVWRGRADGTYELTRGDEPAPRGTRVRLRAKPGRIELFEPARVRAGLSRYGSLLPCRIELTTSEGVERIDAPPPWRREHESASARREAMLAFGRDVFGVDFFDYVPLESRAGGVDGVAFVLPHATVTAARRADRVYLKGMLLGEKADNLLPDWAFFVRAVVDVRELRPLASRESFFEDATLAAARETLGDGIKAYLRELARSDRERLELLLALHHHPIKQLAEEDAEFLMLVARWLPFETTAGLMSFESYLARERTILYARTVDAFRQIAPLVSAQGRCAINAGYVHELAILKRYAELTERPIEAVDASSLADSFAELDLRQREDVRALVRVADAVLAPFRCDAEVKRFSPATLPALFSSGDDATFLRTIERTKAVSEGGLWSDVLDDLASSRGSSRRARFTMNYESPTIRRLARVDDPELLRRLIEVLYVQTLLLGHHPLSAAEMNLVNEGITGLIELHLDRGGRTLQ